MDSLPVRTVHGANGARIVVLRLTLVVSSMTTAIPATTATTIIRQRLNLQRTRVDMAKNEVVMERPSQRVDMVLVGLAIVVEIRLLLEGSRQESLRDKGKRTNEC
jgi:hypothetical protein